MNCHNITSIVGVIQEKAHRGILGKCFYYFCFPVLDYESNSFSFSINMLRYRYLERSFSAIKVFFSTKQNKKSHLFLPLLSPVASHVVFFSFFPSCSVLFSVLRQQGCSKVSGRYLTSITFRFFENIFFQSSFHSLHSFTVNSLH